MRHSQKNRVKYPFHAQLLVGMAWVFSFFIIGASFLGLALMLPLIPVFLGVVFGVTCFLGTVHDYAARVAHVEPRSAKLASSACPADVVSHP